MEKLQNIDKTSKPIRNSNIECLRIISMLMIIATHAVRTVNSFNNVNAVVYVGIKALCSWGVIGVDLFIIISAWFLCNQNFRISKVISIVFQTFTWVLANTVLFFLFDLRQSQSLLDSIGKLFADVGDSLAQPLWASCYWFVTAYIFILFISPLINKMIDSLPQKSVKNILLLFIFVPIYSQFGTSVVGDIAYFAYLYLLIAYIKQYGFAALKQAAKLKNIVLLTAIIFIAKILCYLETASPIAVFFQYLLYHTFAASGRHSVVMLIDALLIFFWVIDLKPRHVNFVNKIAENTLGVYLFHEKQSFGYPKVVDIIFSKFIRIGFINTSVLFPLQYIAITVLVFTLGVTLEYLRQIFIQKPFMKFLNRKYYDKFEKVDVWFASI